MDAIRRSYRTKCRFFRDSDREVDILWFPVAAGAADLGVESAINSIDWDDPVDQFGGVGEVPGANRPFVYKPAIPYAVGMERCGADDDFRDGAAFDPAAPPQLYDEEGLALCCSDVATAEFLPVVEFQAVDSIDPPAAPYLPTTCLGAEVISPNVWYTRTVRASNNGYVQFLGPYTGTGHIRLADPAQPFRTTVRQRGGCFFPFFGPQVPEGQTCVSFGVDTQFLAEHVWFAESTGADWVVTFMWGTGPC